MDTFGTCGNTGLFYQKTHPNWPASVQKLSAMNDAIIRVIVLILAFTIVKTFPVPAQESDSIPYRNKAVVLPFASYTPETRLMFGAMLNYQFKPRGAGPETRASQVLFSGIYTLKRQLVIELIPNIILSQERWMLDGYYQYSFFPDSYWGVGPDTRSEDELDVEYRRLEFRQLALRRIAPQLYAGPALRWNRLSRVEFTNGDGEEVPPARIEGAEGSTLTGLGFSVRWDKRNSITAPTKNHYLELTALFYPELFGTTHPHQSWRLDARKYFDLRNDRKSVLAFQFRLHATAGEIPFQEYALLGGREIMRGYYMGRFRDASAAQVQGEFRQHLFGRFGFTVFAATGEVWNRIQDFSLNNPKFAAGAGLRFNLNPDDPSNIRLDYGIGRHGGGLYVTIGEAF